MWESFLRSRSQQVGPQDSYLLQQQYLAARYPTASVNPQQQHAAFSHLSTQQQHHAAANHPVTSAQQRSATIIPMAPQQTAYQQYPFISSQMLPSFHTQQPQWSTSYLPSGISISQNQMVARVQSTQGSGNAVKQQRPEALSTTFPSHIPTKMQRQPEESRPSSSLSLVRPWEVETPSLPSLPGTPGLPETTNSVLNTPQLYQSDKQQPLQLSSSHTQEPRTQGAMFQQLIDNQTPQQQPQSTDITKYQQPSVSAPISPKWKPSAKRKLDLCSQNQVKSNRRKLIAPAKHCPIPKPCISELQLSQDVNSCDVPSDRLIPIPDTPQPLIQAAVAANDPTPPPAPRGPRPILQKPILPTSNNLPESVEKSLSSLLDYISRSTLDEASEALRPVAKKMKTKMAVKEPAQRQTVLVKKKTKSKKKMCELCTK